MSDTPDTSRDAVERLAQERDEKAAESRVWADNLAAGGRRDVASGWALAAEHAELTAATLRALATERDQLRALLAEALEALHQCNGVFVPGNDAANRILATLCRRIDGAKP